MDWWIKVLLDSVEDTGLNFFDIGVAGEFNIGADGDLLTVDSPDTKEILAEVAMGIQDTAGGLQAALALGLFQPE